MPKSLGPSFIGLVVAPKHRQKLSSQPDGFSPTSSVIQSTIIKVAGSDSERASDDGRHSRQRRRG